MNTLRLPLIKIGNSRGIRIPKSIIEQLGLESEVEISTKKEKLVIHRPSRPREGWEKHAREMAKRGDDRLLDPPTPTVFDEEEWEW